MKKVFVSLFIFIFSLFLISCNENTDNQIKIDYLSLVNGALEEIVLPGSTTKDINLPEKINYFGHDVLFTWETSDDAISSNGKVTQKENDVTVYLTVTATLENETVTKTLDEPVIVKAKITCKHDELVLINEVPATFDSEGCMAHYYCEVCNKYFDINKNEVSYSSLIIPKLIPEKNYIRFTEKVLNAYVDKDYTLEYDTSYEGELTWDVDSYYIWFDGSSFTALEVGTTVITASFTLEGEIYFDSITVVITEEKYSVNIEGETYYVIAGDTYDDLLLDLYGEDEYPTKEGYEFIGWYFDQEFKDSCSTYRKVENGITLYPKYRKYYYGIEINNVLGYKSSQTFGGDVIAISPAYTYNVNTLDLSKYDLVTVEYNVQKGDYFVIEHGTKNVPFDGFLVCINKEIEKHDEYLEKLAIGNIVYLDSYSINKTTRLTFEYDIESVSTISSSALTANFAYAYDVTNKKQLLSKDGATKAYPASTTKIITGMVACKYCPLDTTYTIGGEIDVMYEGSSPSTAGLVQGQVWTLRDLLYAMLLPSGNDAAYSVAACTINYLYPDNNWTSRQQIDKFAELMNEMAETVGATGSHFTVPDGNSYYKAGGSASTPSLWDDRLTYHYVTASDMVKFARYAFAMGEMAEVVSTTTKTVTIGSKTYTFSNTNSLLSSNKYVVGMKTGTTTPAGACLVTGAFKDGRFVICAVLKSGDRYSDTSLLLSQIFR